MSLFSTFRDLFLWLPFFITLVPVRNFRKFYLISSYQSNFPFQLVRCNVDFIGAQVADVNGDSQWTQGIPGDGYFAKQPNAYLAISATAKVSVGTLSTVWLNENSVLSMDE